MQYRRHLPHLLPDGASFHVTWRLAQNLPAPQPEILRCGDRKPAPAGPMWLTDPGIAQMVVEALRYGQEQRGFYTLRAYVVMPNHVHILIEPYSELAAIMRWLKGRTARMPNRILGRMGQAFWQDESYDHFIRSPQELTYTARYIEENPLRAGLVESADQWLWSSAAPDRPQKTMACPTSYKIGAPNAL